MAHIIISYRRADSDAIAGRIRDKLATHFGEDSVFMDIDSIPFGIDFREHIKEALAKNDILVAVIGPKWLGATKGGRLRIAEETDPVRIEVETALKNGSAVIPILVNGAKMPKPAELPDTLKDLSFRNAAEVDAGRDFHQHMDRLIRSMERLLERSGKGAPAPAAGQPIVVTAPPATPHLVGLLDEPALPPQPLPQPGAPPATAPAPQPPAETIAPTPQQIAPSKRAFPVLWLAVSAGVVALLATGAGLFVKYKDQIFPPPVEQKTVVVAPIPKPPEPTPTPKPAEPKPMPVLSGCKLDVPLALADDFKAVDLAWVLPADVAYYADGQLALKPMEGKTARVLYPSFRFKNATVCATVKSPPAPPEGTATNGGVIFWATDTSNFYVASVHPNGMYSVYRQASGSWADVILPAPHDAIKKGTDALNEVKVTTNDRVATLFVNGVKITDFRGQPPKEDSAAGVYAASNNNERNEWRVINAAVGDPSLPKQQAALKLPPPQAGPGCKPLRQTSFEDDFKSPDPGWGLYPNTPFSFVDGQAAIKPAANRSWRQLFESLFFKNATICAQVKFPAQLKNFEGTSNGGLAFWASNTSHYYAAAIHPNGYFSINRFITPNWSRIVPPTKSAAIKTGLGAVNDVMLVYNQGLAAFYVNGQKIHEFRGQPPASGGSMGMFAGSEEDAEDEWRFLNIVVVENE
jgi:hypothetical protein